MANNSGVVGVLRALLTADTAQFDTSMRKSAQTTEKTADSLSKLGKETAKLTPQAERMAKAFGGERLLASANNLAAAVTKIGGASKLTEAEQRRVNSTLDAAIAKYRALGQQAPKDMIAIANATKQAGSATSILGTSFATLTASFTTAAIVTGATTALTGFVRSAISGAGALVDLSGKTKLSTETLQRMDFVAGQTGATLDDFTTSSFQLGIRVAEGSTKTQQAFADLAKSSDALGMSFKQFQALTPDEQFERVTAALHDVDDVQERNRLGVLLMGKTYAQIAAAVSENYNEMAKAARVSSDEQVRAIDDAADAWGAFLKSTTTNIQANLGQIVLFSQAVRKAVEELGPFASSFAVVARAQEILRLGLLKTREQDIELTADLAKTNDSYVAMLKQVQAEIAGLTTSERAELDAAIKLGTSTDDLQNKFFKTSGAAEFYKSNLEKVAKAAKDLIEAQHDLRDDVEKVATDIEKVIQAATDVDNLQAFKLEWQQIVDLLERASDESASINAHIGTLDELRTRELLQANPPGVILPKEKDRWKQHGVRIAGSVSDGIREKLKDAFEDIPHFLTSSLLHSGSFINGLKALGVSMADAIAEPLLRQLGRRIASGIASWAGGRTAAAVANNSGGGKPWWSILPALLPGGGAPPPDPNRKGQPKNPTTPPPPAGGGIVPIPPTPGRGDPHVPTPPPISKTSIPRINLSGFAPPAVSEPMAFGSFSSDASGASSTVMSQGPSTNNVNVNFNIQAIDAAGVRDFVKSDRFLNELRSAFRLNRSGVGTTMRHITTGET